MTITITLKDEAAQIVQQQIADGRYPDAESAVSAALMLLDDAAMGLTDVDAEGVKRMIAESDDEGGEVSLSEAMQRLGTAISTTRQR
jgi:Arc/MetJ-type ribon-helix-helix transcriptional regulator